MSLRHSQIGHHDIIELLLKQTFGFQPVARNVAGKAVSDQGVRGQASNGRFVIDYKGPKCGFAHGSYGVKVRGTTIESLAYTLYCATG